MLYAILGTASAIRVQNSREYVQLDSSRVIEQGDDFNGWGANMHNFTGTVNEHGNYMDAYERVIPDYLVGNEAIAGVGSTDLFTQNVLTNFAVEDKVADPLSPDFGKPTGELWITRDSGYKLAQETLCTHFNKCGADGDKWLTEAGPYTGEPRFDSAFDYYDVNKAGKVHAIGQTGSMLRHLFRPLGWLDI